MINFSRYAAAQNIASTIDDILAPYSFKDWLLRNTHILPDKQVLQYERYVKQWYVDRDNQPTTAQTIKEDYISLVRQLTLAFKNEADALRFADIDFNDQNELEQVIPFYTSKLKEIAIYLINKREAVRRAKLKYNMTGTYTALERIFYEYLLKAFTKADATNEYSGNAPELDSLPELSAVNTNFQIQVEELYDDASYFDRDPSLPASAYFSFTDDVTAYLDQLNIAPQDIEWLYSTGVSQLCADNPLLWSIDSLVGQFEDGVPLSAIELPDSAVLNDYNRIRLTQKYIGENQYIISGGYFAPWVNTIAYDFLSGNNWFYWITGENVFENNTYVSYAPLALSSSQLILDGATAGYDITGSDIIFASRGDSLSGAWLQAVDRNLFNETMSARLGSGKTIFGFPFPGYGVSGEGLLWSGKSFDNLDQTFFYLDRDTQAAIYDAYWRSFDDSGVSVIPTYINESDLVECGALPATRFSQADYIISRDNFRDGNDDFVYTGKQQYAWLYKMERTDIPIQISGNNVYWPYAKYETDIPIIQISKDICEPVRLDSETLRYFAGAIAGHDYEHADKIYKKTSPNSDNYSEGVWLSGAPLPQPLGISTVSMTTSGAHQPGLAMRVLGGAYGSFIWTDSNTRADDVFTWQRHQDDCWYLHGDQFSLENENPAHRKDLNYNKWMDCTCRALLYTPLGHPGDKFDDHNRLSDFVVAVTEPTEKFNFNSWRGLDNNDYVTSDDFGWFKLDGQYSVEPDVGYGSGHWVTNNGTPFTLKNNVMYWYFRNSLRRDLPEVNAPYLIVRKAFNDPKCSWRKLEFNGASGIWIDAGVDSDLVFNPGDTLWFDHSATISFTLTSSHFEITSADMPVLPDFSKLELESTSNLAQTSLKSIPFEQPIQTIDLERYDPGSMGPNDTVPIKTIDTIKTTYVDIPDGDINIKSTIGIPNIGNIGNTETIEIKTEVIDYYTYNTDSINYILNMPLLGWNYTTHTYDHTSFGARPFWAFASDEDDDFTKQKGINIWSGSPTLVDDYIFVSQPPFSNLEFKNNTYIEYNRRNNTPIIWTQQLSGQDVVQEKHWCKIITKPTVSNLTSILANNTYDFIVSATNIPSDLILDVVQDQPLHVNYFARNDFTWTQNLTNTSNGIPPTGGLWFPIISGALVTPDMPYAHLSNRHYPTYASAPHIGELYTIKDSGGYMIPKMLGATTAVSKDMENILSAENLDNDPLKRGVTAIYRELDIYNSDRGLSKADQIEPVLNISTDSSWMKAGITEGQKSGTIVGSRLHREFTPYQTQFENTGNNENGIFRQGIDAYDPWFGEFDDEWENKADWPANWRQQYDIKGWYESIDFGDLQVYNWKTDIFGNQYAVMKKDFTDKTIYEKKHEVVGQLWTRDARNVISKADQSLVHVFEYMPDELVDYDFIDDVLDIDIWYDTLMVYNEDALIFCHLNFDFDTGIISSQARDLNYIIMDQSKFAGTWFFENSKTVTICTMLSCVDGQIRPILRSLDLESNQIDILYNIPSEHTDMTQYGLTIFDHPVFTYDTNRRIYNVSYIGYGADRADGMFVTSINIKETGGLYEIIDAQTITPELVD